MGIWARDMSGVMVGTWLHPSTSICRSNSMSPSRDMARESLGSSIKGLVPLYSSDVAMDEEPPEVWRCRRIGVLY